MQLTVQRCKTFERLVKERLVPSSSVLEPMANGDLTKFQRGFRKQRSTTDQLVQLEFYTKNLCAPRTRRDRLRRPEEGLRVLRHDVEERHSSRSVYNASHAGTASPAHIEVCTRSSVSSASRFLSVRRIFSGNGSSARNLSISCRSPVLS